MPFTFCRVLSVLIAIAFCFAVGSAALGQDMLNIVINGGFEDGLSGWDYNSDCSLDTTVNKFGKNSAKITRVVDNNRWSIIQQVFDATPGVSYKVKVWAKFENVSQTHCLVMWLNAENQGVGTIYLFTGMNGTRNWFESSATVVAPKDAAKLRLQYYGGWPLDGQGQAFSWLDDVEVEPLPEIPKIDAAAWQQLVRAKYGETLVAPPMRDKVIYFDKRYESSWIKNQDNILDFFTSRSFNIKNADETRTWMLDKINEGADGTVCILSMGVVPDTISESIDHKCTLRRYLDAGGRVVWIGDIPLHYRSFAIRTYVLWGMEHTSPSPIVLGIRPGTRNMMDNRSVITDVGKEWGMQQVDSPVRTFHEEDVTLLFSEVEGTQYVSSFFKTYNPEFPYGGFIRYFDGAYDGENDELNAGLYKMALYRGTPIKVPAVAKKKEEKKPALLTINTRFNNYRRGQDIPVKLDIEKGVKAESMRLVLIDGTKVVREYTAKFKPEPLFVVNTKNLASKEYIIKAALMSKGKAVAVTQKPVYLAPHRTEKVYMGVYGVSGAGSEYKAHIILKDIREHLGESAVISGGFGYMHDEALRYGVGVMPVSHAYYESMVSKTQELDLQMRVSTGNLPKYHYGGMGAAPSCMANPINRRRINHNFQKEIRSYYGYPAFIKRMYVSDDAAMFGDPHEQLLACYCQYCKDEFKRLTCYDAPLAPSDDILKNKGVVENNDPWYQWMKYRSLTSYGGWNASMNAAKDEIDPQIKFGPEHSGGWDPVFNPQWALNPPDDYGAIGMVSFYYYPQLQLPVVNVLKHMELAVMGNRDKELWVTPQSSDYAKLINDDDLHSALIRNQFYFLLAGGVTGMSWFEYTEMPQTAPWEAMKPLADIATKHGPMLRALKRKTAQVAVLASWANASYQWAAGSKGENLFVPLLKAHIPAQFLADEEILEGALKNYRVLALSDMDFLTRSVYDAILSFIADGGTVVIESGSAIDIPGSSRVELADMPTEIAKSIHREFDIDNPDIVSTVFTDGSATYLMLVNQQMEKAAKGTVTLGSLKGLKAYDVFSGRQINTAGDKLDLTIPASQGKLIGFYPSKPAKITIEPVDQATRGSAATVKVRVTDSSGKPVGATFGLRIKMTDSKGQDTEYSDHYAAKAGSLDFSFVIATNEPTGEWKLEVTELSSGIKSASKFLVK